MWKNNLRIIIINSQIQLANINVVVLMNLRVPFYLLSSFCKGLWLLRRMSSEVWEHHCLEILHRDIWLSLPVCHYWREDFLCSRRAESQYTDTWPDQNNRQEAGGSAWWSHVWSSLEWPRGHPGMGSVTKRSRIFVWKWCCQSVQCCKWYWDDLSSSSVGYGGLQMAFQWDCSHCLVCS